MSILCSFQFSNVACASFEKHLTFPLTTFSLHNSFSLLSPVYLLLAADRRLPTVNCGLQTVLTLRLPG